MGEPGTSVRALEPPRAARARPCDTAPALRAEPPKLWRGKKALCVAVSHRASLLGTGWCYELILKPVCQLANFPQPRSVDHSNDTGAHRHDARNARRARPQSDARARVGLAFKTCCDQLQARRAPCMRGQHRKHALGYDLHFANSSCVASICSRRAHSALQSNCISRCCLTRQRTRPAAKAPHECNDPLPRIQRSEQPERNERRASHVGANT